MPLIRLADQWQGDAPVLTLEAWSLQGKRLVSIAVEPAAAKRCRDSGRLDFTKGNPWSAIGTWDVTLP